jgi:CDP-glycerol glycerophosphotransferase (TagB/SpsB family)
MRKRNRIRCCSLFFRPAPESGLERVSMNPKSLVKWARKIDTNLHRRLDPVRRVLINARTPMNYAVIAPIHRAMRGDERVAFYLLASERPSRAKEVFQEATDGRLITPTRARLMKFDAYLAADFLWVHLPRGTCRIQMFHGVGGKYGNVYDRPDRSMREWDRFFFINRRRFRNFIDAGAIDADSPAGRLVGMPKLDCLVDGSLRRDEVLAQLGLDPEQKIVLYAPTWSPFSSLNSMGFELVRGLCAAGYTVIVKLHDRSRDPEYVHSGGVNWPVRLNSILRPRGGRVAEGSDASPYLAAADVLITDHSSVGFEYLLLDRPVIRIEMPELIVATNTSSEYVALMADASTTVSTARQAIAAVERCLDHPSNLSAERRAVVNELFYKPGSATSRAVREVYDAIELDPLSVEERKESYVRELGSI